MTKKLFTYTLLLSSIFLVSCKEDFLSTQKEESPSASRVAEDLRVKDSKPLDFSLPISTASPDSKEIPEPSMLVGFLGLLSYFGLKKRTN